MLQTNACRLRCPKKFRNLQFQASIYKVFHHRYMLHPCRTKRCASRVGWTAGRTCWELSIGTPMRQRARSWTLSTNQRHASWGGTTSTPCTTRSCRSATTSIHVSTLMLCADPISTPVPKHHLFDCRITVMLITFLSLSSYGPLSRDTRCSVLQQLDATLLTGCPPHGVCFGVQACCSLLRALCRLLKVPITAMAFRRLEQWLGSRRTIHRRSST